MKKIIKIGRFYYEKLNKDKHGEPKLLKDDKDEKMFILVDFEGEPVEYFKKLNSEQKHDK